MNDVGCHHGENRGQGKVLDLLNHGSNDFPYHGGDPIYRPQPTFLLRSGPDGGKTIEPGVVIFVFLFFFPLCVGYLLLCNSLAYTWDSSVAGSWFVYCGGNFDS